MEKTKIEELITKYNEGVADPKEIKWIEQLLETGQLDLTQLRELSYLDEQILKMESPSPSLTLDDHFYAALVNEKRKLKKETSFSLPSLSFIFPRLAMAAVLILIGFGVGYFLQSPSHKNDVRELSQEVSDLKEMIMLSMIEKESATQRLKAVSLTSEMNQVSDKVTNALFAALNQDDNVNVRLAALEALKPYIKEGDVRTRLIKSIGVQDSPLVQIALAEFMVSIQEKKSVDELKLLLENEGVPKEVKNKISESIKILI
jgi:hypothetical protein